MLGLNAHSLLLSSKEWCRTAFFNGSMANQSKAASGSGNHTLIFCFCFYKVINYYWFYNAVTTSMCDSFSVRTGPPISIKYCHFASSATLSFTLSPSSVFLRTREKKKKKKKRVRCFGLWRVFAFLPKH